MTQQIGPKETVIPEKKFLDCRFCKFYESHIIKTGRNPERSYNCKHPEMKGDWNTYLGNLPNTYITPDYCPILLENKNEA